MIARLMGLKTISPAALHELVQRGTVTAIDVNARPRWETARVPGAINLDSAGFVDGDLPSEKASMLVFYCSGPLCRKAPNAARRAERMGYRNVHVMSAGISGWLDAALPTESGAVRA